VLFAIFVPTPKDIVANGGVPVGPLLKRTLHATFGLKKEISINKYRDNRNEII